jgi:hypothetical protein
MMPRIFVTADFFKWTRREGELKKEKKTDWAGLWIIEGLGRAGEVNPPF